MRTLKFIRPGSSCPVTEEECSVSICHDEVQYTKVQHSTAQYSTVQCCSARVGWTRGAQAAAQICSGLQMTRTSDQDDGAMGTV